jgi:CrcB protein
MMYIAVATGGALGALLRYSLVMFAGFPSAILMANIIGSCIMGAIVGGQHAGVFTWPPAVQVFVMMGVLGAFTTFSSFSFEAFTLFQEGAVRAAVAYVLASVLLALIGFALGYKLISFF